MGNFYGTKIKDAEVNQKTGKAWTMEDVPSFWRKATEKWITEN